MIMNFLYDLTASQPTPDSKFHGAGTYGEIVFLKIIQKLDDSKTQLFAAYDSSRYLNKDLLAACMEKKVTLIDIRKEDPKNIISSYKIDRFYSALLDESIGWNFRNAQVVTTVHGLRGLELPVEKIIYKYETSLKAKVKDFLKLTFLSDYYRRKIYNGYKRFFDGSMKIVTVSQHSKASIISFFPNMKEDDIKVCASPTFDQVKDCYTKPCDFAQISQKYNIEKKKYFLVTSSARWLKNAMRAVFAFDSLFDDGKIKDFKLVLTGVNNKSVFEKQIRHKERFVLTNYVERDELESLNENAYAFIYPTLNEGFGYPPVEAMKYGVPCACSGTSSVPEVCGNSVLYFDPYNVTEIKNRVIQLCDKEIYSVLCSLSQARYKAVSQMQKEDLDSLVDYLLKNL